MADIIIQGTTYPLPDNFTFREAAKIKRETGLLTGQMSEAFTSGDSAVVLALVMVALDRAGVTGIDPFDVPIGDVTLDFTDETAEQEDESVPLAPGSEGDGSAADVAAAPAAA